MGGPVLAGPPCTHQFRRRGSTTARRAIREAPCSEVSEITHRALPPRWPPGRPALTHCRPDKQCRSGRGGPTRCSQPLPAQPGQGAVAPAALTISRGPLTDRQRYTAVTDHHGTGKQAERCRKCIYALCILCATWWPVRLLVCTMIGYGDSIPLYAARCEACCRQSAFTFSEKVPHISTAFDRATEEQWLDTLHIRCICFARQCWPYTYPA